MILQKLFCWLGFHKRRAVRHPTLMGPIWIRTYCKYCPWEDWRIECQE